MSNVLYVQNLEKQIAGQKQLIAEQNRLNKERQEWALHTSEVIRSLNQQLAAEQAKNMGLRDVLEHIALNVAFYGDDWVRITVSNALGDSTLSDTSVLESMIAKAGETMREGCRSAASDVYGELSTYEAIRALPGGTLEDLK